MVNDNYNGTAALTVGNVYIPSNTYDYPTTYGFPQWNITYNSPPAYCAGDVHVWGCEHATACKCGKATRMPEPKKCGSCGKAV
jgi:hypothetical protein